MKIIQYHEGTAMLELEPGERLIESINAYCAAQSVRNGSLQAIGAVSSVRLMHLRRAPTRERTHKTFNGGLELANVIGVVKKGVVHVHGTFGRPDFSSVSGHVMEATADPLIQITILPIRSKSL